MSFFKRRPIVDEHDSDGDNDGNIDPELRLRTVRTAASALEVSVKTEQRAEKRKSRRFFSRKKKDLQPSNQPSGPRRNVYVNYPLSAMEVDRDGEPRARYVRNKVRTTSTPSILCSLLRCSIKPRVHGPHLYPEEPLRAVSPCCQSLLPYTRCAST
jgi:hypothetical protein